ncbi:MAG: ribonuclease E activity regulator RraA [Gammaproteobacteria bacterium]
MTFATANLYDDHAERVQVALPGFRNYGGRKCFCGPVATLKVYEDNSLVREQLEQPGNGRVLVVDGGASVRCALLGDNLAQLGKDNGWEGIVVYGCIRDSAVIADIDIGVKALDTMPAKSEKRGEGQQDVVLRFSGLVLKPGMFLYADEDGMLASDEPLL